VPNFTESPSPYTLALSPCRFCGSNMIGLVSNYVYDDSLRRKILKYAIVCNSCESHGPVSNTSHDATEGWNGVPSLEQAKDLEKVLSRHFERWLNEQIVLGQINPTALAQEALSVFRQTN
jgi:hypothetical protein